ncbi:SIS domain-containing protein [Thermosulfurimonas marina]|uniref:Phosphoheptose isomerase n=1 Tax=Thermosulfurimonas marina TaxID=2047767 RepID=A0A6H1WS07_9BACT|nr:SIS domain-containing protein [Thermosulfurimonas marina]QJA05958.1 SIS domain-containing protein [Thermosulfurimonas marina]
MKSPFPKARLLEILEASHQATRAFIEKEGEKILSLVTTTWECFVRGGKLLIFGNGGSAADAQHLAAELVNRFRRERSPLPALALTTDTSILTAIGNDYDFELIFVKQIEALGRPGDIALGISTSGRSANVIRALSRARELDLYTVGLGGGDGGRLPEVCDLVLLVPSNETPRIQEGHLLFLHLFAELLEEACFGETA